MRLAFRFLCAAALLVSAWSVQAAAHPEVRWVPLAEKAHGAPPNVLGAKAFSSDPTGDNFGSLANRPDISSISADVANNMLLITINFANSISPPNSGRPDALVGFIDIDSDGNTGESSNDLQGFCPAGQNPAIGADYYVFLFGGSTSSSPVYNYDTDTAAGSAATSYGGSSVTLSIPLSNIGGGGSIKVATVLGNTTEPTDCAPNGSALTAASAAVGPPVVVTGTTQAGSNLTFRSPVAGVRYDWDFDADGVIDRTGNANSLIVTYPGAYSGNVAVLTTDGNGNRTISNMSINTAAPRLTAALVGTTATIVCGDGDNQLEPGETVQFPIRITNSGNATSDANGAVVLAPQDRVQNTNSSIDGKVIVQTPIITVGSLAPGGSMNANVLLTFSTSAAFNTTYGVLYSGGLDGASSSAGSSAALGTLTTAASGSVYTGACSALDASKANIVARQGLYFNPSRSGNGLSNFVIPVAGGSPVFFGAWFTGAADHTPTWYIVQGSLVGNTVVAPIYRFTRNLASSTFAVNAPQVVGQAVVTMKGAEQIVFLWQIGTKSGLELMNYLTPGPAAVPNRTGAWFNTSESGWGEVVHAFSSSGQNNIFTVDYIYDAAGEPRWVLAQATDASLASGTAHSTFQVHCPGCPWIGDWNSFALGSGSGSASFNTTTGSTTTSFTFPVPLAGSWVRTNLPLTLLTPPQ